MVRSKVSQLAMAVSLVLGMGFSSQAVANYVTDTKSGCKVWARVNGHNVSIMSYTGDCKDGYAHGKGTVIWSFQGGKGNYTGDFNNGKIHGIGKANYVEGNSDYGTWREGAFRSRLYEPAPEELVKQQRVSTEAKAEANTPKILTQQEQADLMAKGMWYDERTGLIWSRCSVGLTWNGVACTGELKEFTWAEANQFLQSYSLNGYSGWRIPSHSEFQTLKDCNAVAPKGNDERTYRTQIYDNEEYYHCGDDIDDKDKKSRTPFAFIQPSMGWDRTSYWTSTTNNLGRELFWMNKNSRDGVELGHNHFCPVDRTNCTSHLFLVNDTYFLGNQSIKNIFLAIKNEEGKTITEQRKIDEEKARIEAEEDRLRAEQARKEQEAYDRKVAAFRKNLQVGDDAKQGMVIEIKGNLIKIQTNDRQCTQRDYNGKCTNYMNTPVEKWVKRSELYPAD